MAERGYFGMLESPYKPIHSTYGGSVPQKQRDMGDFSPKYGGYMGDFSADIKDYMGDFSPISKGKRGTYPPFGAI